MEKTTDSYKDSVYMFYASIRIFRLIPFSIPFRFPFRVLVTPGPKWASVVSTLAWNRKVSDMIHGRYHLFCSRNAIIYLLGDVAMLDL